jgi:hypothetical protein
MIAGLGLLAGALLPLVLLTILVGVFLVVAAQATGRLGGIDFRRNRLVRILGPTACLGVRGSLGFARLGHHALTRLELRQTLRDEWAHHRHDQDIDRVGPQLSENNQFVHPVWGPISKGEAEKSGFGSTDAPVSGPYRFSATYTRVVYRMATTPVGPAWCA